MEYNLLRAHPRLATRGGDFTPRMLLILALCVGSGLAHLGTSAMPFQVGALMDGTHRTASEAGLFGFLQVGALSFGMILISPWVGRVSPRRVALVGCLMAALGNAGLFSCTSLFSQLALAAATGLGYGLVFAAVVAGAAASQEPDRVYGIGNGGALLLIVGLMSFLPAIAIRLGPMGIFGALAVLAVLSAPSFLAFRRSGRSESSPLSPSRVPGAMGLLAIWAGCSAGTGGLYAFSERIGTHIGIPAAQLALVLSAGVFIGLVGTGAAAILGGRIDRPAALLIGATGSAVSCALMGLATNLAGFAAGVFVYWVFYMFLYSYLLGTAAVLDPTGRIGALGGGVERLGYALGAAVAGYLSDHTTYAVTGVSGLGVCLMGMGLGFPRLCRALKVTTP